MPATIAVENLSLSALIYLSSRYTPPCSGWESFIISLDILIREKNLAPYRLRIFHYQPWYTYRRAGEAVPGVENLSLSALIYLWSRLVMEFTRWESFIISLDILTQGTPNRRVPLRIFHYQPWYTYFPSTVRWPGRWESFIISLDILTAEEAQDMGVLRIFHYQPWYTYILGLHHLIAVENLSLSALIYL